MTSHSKVKNPSVNVEGAGQRSKSQRGPEEYGSLFVELVLGIPCPGERA